MGCGYFDLWHIACIIRCMKAAFTIWKNRIAPVFDVAGQAVLVQMDQVQTLVSTFVSLPEGSVAAKVQVLSGLGVQVLVCGAMSRAAFELAVAEKIEVVSFVAGDTDHVIQAWLQGSLSQADFAMPGCRHRRRRRCCKQVSTEFKVPSSKLEE